MGLLRLATLRELSTKPAPRDEQVFSLLETRVRLLVRLLYMQADIRIRTKRLNR